MTITIISTLRDRTPVPQPDPLAEAEVVWGAPSNFSWGSTAQNFNANPIPRISSGGPNPPDDPEDPLVQPPITYRWTETARRESTVRINGPDGAYVDFARIEEITFRLPDQADGTQVYVVQSFNNQTDATAPVDTTPITPKIIIVPKSTA